ncbi:MAG TPA: hypothetical protein VMV90_06260 [Rectinemataceae bacterium]|nr:hypothetical protein [Rectinemataceae bacterium]
MKIRSAVAAALFLIAAAGAAFAQTAKARSPDFALGVFLGEPTGITLRWGLAKDQSLEGKAAWSFVNSSNQSASFTFQANYLMEFPGVLVIKQEDFPLYVGFGAETHLGNSTSFGLRIPGGVIYRFAKAPIELCLELGVGMELFPATTLVGSGGLGIRYRF